jgi:hypothetical protein
LSDEFREQYAWYLLEELRLRLPQVPDLPQSAVGLNIEQAEKALGKSVWLKVRTEAWLHVLVRLSVVLIDMPDYSKSDRRLMTSDLNEIYWLWNRLAADSHPPNLVIAVQKEMFGGHFFDKMHKIELKPLNPEQMVEAYERRFGTLNPFTAEVLATLARMSRGVFRRYLRYISMAIEHWEGQPTHNESIEASLVKEAIPIERLAEDMELELSELFPKQGDLRYQSVQLLLHLQAHGPQGQTQLAQTLDIQEYQLTRLLQKLERNRYIKREKRGKDKLVKLIDEAT